MPFPSFLATQSFYFGHTPKTACMVVQYYAHTLLLGFKLSSSRNGFLDQLRMNGRWRNHESMERAEYYPLKVFRRKMHLSEYFTIFKEVHWEKWAQNALRLDGPNRRYRLVISGKIRQSCTKNKTSASDVCAHASDAIIISLGMFLNLIIWISFFDTRPFEAIVNQKLAATDETRNCS